jgi:CubicO group peptidase (beta-lactamase class C family)
MTASLGQWVCPVILAIAGCLHGGRLPVPRAVVEKGATGKAEEAYFPPPESQGGWRTLGKPKGVRRVAGMDPVRLDELKEWLLQSDDRKFAAVVIRNGYVVLEVERGNSSRADTGNVKSCAKAVCATVLAIASEESRKGKTPRRMKFDDPAFDFIPWAQPLSDPRKAKITVRQLLNQTSGLAPESTGARNRGPWEYVLGHSGDAKTAKLAFDPGADLGYSTHGLYHASLVSQGVTGLPYDEFAIKMLLRPIGVEKWWFEYFDGGDKVGRHPSHALGLPARDLARVAHCMLHGGRWGERQVIPKWFVEETASATHALKGRKDFGRDAESFSHGWELPGLLSDGRGKGIPQDARFKPGSGGQLVAFVPSLNLVVVRQTGGSGKWEYEEYLRRACAAVLPGRER